MPFKSLAHSKLALHLLPLTFVMAVAALNFKQQKWLHDNTSDINLNNHPKLVDSELPQEPSRNPAAFRSDGRPIAATFQQKLSCSTSNWPSEIGLSAPTRSVQLVFEDCKYLKVTAVVNRANGFEATLFSSPMNLSSSQTTDFIALDGTETDPQILHQFEITFSDGSVRKLDFSVSP